MLDWLQERLIDKNNLEFCLFVACGQFFTRNYSVYFIDLSKQIHNYCKPLYVYHTHKTINVVHRNRSQRTTDATKYVSTTTTTVIVEQRSHVKSLQKRDHAKWLLKKTKYQSQCQSATITLSRQDNKTTPSERGNTGRLILVENTLTKSICTIAIRHSCLASNQGRHIERGITRIWVGGAKRGFLGEGGISFSWLRIVVVHCKRKGKQFGNVLSNVSLVSLDSMVANVPKTYCSSC